MNTTTSHSQSSARQTGRADANACVTLYPPQWLPAMVRARATELPAGPRTPAPAFPFLAYTLLLCGAGLCLAAAGSAAPLDLHGGEGRATNVAGRSLGSHLSPQPAVLCRLQLDHPVAPQGPLTEVALVR